MSNLALAAKSLGKTYHDAGEAVQVLNNFNLEVAKGECLAIVGASGAGKSTLLHLLGGLDTPTAGTVEVDGQDLFRLNEAKRGRLRNQKIGFIYQFHHLLPELTALENAAMPLIIGGASVAKASAQAKELLQRVGLEKRLTHKPAQLSGGERQRAAIARALVTNPAVVLADEPTGNLDVANAETVYQLMLELNADLGTSLVIVTHDQTLAAQTGRTVELLRQD